MLPNSLIGEFTKMTDLQILVNFLKENLSRQLSDSVLGEEYFYQHLTLAAIDAVFSAQARYPSVQSVVQRYCDKYQLTRTRPSREVLPTSESQESINSLILKMDQNGTPYFIEQVFKNRSKTSGRFKAEILLELLKKVESLGIQDFQDMQYWLNKPHKLQILVSLIIKIHGIGDATFRYFLMLAGDKHMVKPDTMILRFLKNALGRPVREAEAVQLIQATSYQLCLHYPNLSPRLLDNIIWSWQRNQETQNINQSSKLKNTTKITSSKVIPLAKPMTIPQKTQQAMLRRYSPGSMLSSSQIKDDVLTDYKDISRGSIIPTDYCCNKWNKDPSSGIYHIFFYVKEDNKFLILPTLDITKPRQRGMCP